MRNAISPLSIAAPARPGEPATLDCSAFQSHLHRFDESLEESFRTEFPGTTLDQLAVEAKCDSGFERFWAGCVAIGFAQGLRAGAQGLRAGKASVFVEAALPAARAATAAVNAKATVKPFSELVSDQVRTGKTKVDAIRFCIQNFPKEYALARVVGIASL